MILVDANILMYAAGKEHPHREPSLAFLKSVAEGGLDAVLDAEVLQEILHRYSAIGRWQEGRRVFDNALTLFPDILPITAETVTLARALLDEVDGLSARDALHAAVVDIHQLDAICSYDGGFDDIVHLRRVQPEKLL